jgi:GR25 family glycosyltransferase involved in LPS biosynthesis
MDFIKKTWVINLDRRPDRFTEFQRRMEEKTISFSNLERFSAIDGKALVDRIPVFLDEFLLHYLKTMLLNQIWTPNWENTEGKESAWTEGEIGCLLSHYSIYMKIQHDESLHDDEFCLVLEDDVFPNQDWKEEITKIGHVLSHHNDVDIVWIAGRNRVNFAPDNKDCEDVYRKIEDGLFHRHGIEPRNEQWYRQTTAYLISKKGAIKLAEELRNRHFVKPIDHCMVDTVHKQSIKQYDWFPHLGYSPMDYKTDVQGGQIITPYQVLRLLLWNHYNKMYRLYSGGRN